MLHKCSCCGKPGHKVTTCVEALKPVVDPVEARARILRQVARRKVDLGCELLEEALETLLNPDGSIPVDVARKLERTLTREPEPRESSIRLKSIAVEEDVEEDSVEALEAPAAPIFEEAGGRFVFRPDACSTKYLESLLAMGHHDNTLTPEELDHAKVELQRRTGSR